MEQVEAMTIDEYIDVYCVPDTKKVGVQVSVNVIQILSLKVIILVLARIEGLALLH